MPLISLTIKILTWYSYQWMEQLRKMNSLLTSMTYLCNLLFPRELRTCYCYDKLVNLLSTSALDFVSLYTVAAFAFSFSTATETTLKYSELESMEVVIRR